MRKHLIIFSISLLTVSLYSCKSEKQTDEIIVDELIIEEDAGPQHMEQTKNSGSVKWIGGAEYSYTITRNSKDSLGVIENNGVKYYDNSISLVVRRVDGTVFFQKTFTKANFAPVLPKMFKESGILLGMSLQEAVNNELHFVVSIGSPDESNEETFYVLMPLDNFGATRAEEYKEKKIKDQEAHV